MADSTELIVERVAVTVPLDSPGGVDLDAAIGAFHGLIQRAAVPGTLIDVADYRHVHHGPAVMLIAHELDYALDLADGDIGMTVTRKRTAGPSELGASVAWCTARALRALAALGQQEPSVGALSARTDELRVRILDRSAVPSTSEGEAAALAALGRVASELLGQGGSAVPEWVAPAPVTVRLSTTDPLSPGDLLAAADAAAGALALT